MKILLTGATGYIGRHLIQAFKENKYEVYCVVRESSNISDIIDSAEDIFVLSENKLLYDYLNKIKPDLVIHVAGMFLVEHTRDNIEQMLSSNIIFPSLLIDAAVSSGCKAFINTSSYWQNYDGHEFEPVNLYASSKQSFEDMIKYYVVNRSVRALTLQLFDVYGPNDERKKVLNLVSHLSDGDSLDMSPGKQKLYMCYIDDVVDAYLHAVKEIMSYKEPIHRKYAVRGEIPCELREIIQKYVQMSGKKVNLNWGMRPYRNMEIMNPEGIGEVLPGWKPSHSLEDGLLKYIRE